MTGRRGDTCTQQSAAHENLLVTTTVHRTTGLLRCIVEERRRSHTAWSPTS